MENHVFEDFKYLYDLYNYKRKTNIVITSSCADEPKESYEQYVKECYEKYEQGLYKYLDGLSKFLYFSL